MRKLIVSNIVSLDGYYEGPGKNVMDLSATASQSTRRTTVSTPTMPSGCAPPTRCW